MHFDLGIHISIWGKGLDGAIEFNDFLQIISISFFQLLSSFNSTRFIVLVEFKQSEFSEIFEKNKHFFNSKYQHKLQLFSQFLFHHRSFYSMVKLGGNGVSPEPKKPKSVVSLDGGTHRVLYFSVEVTACRPVAEPSVPWVCPGGVVFYDFFCRKLTSLEIFISFILFNPSPQSTIKKREIILHELIQKYQSKYKLVKNVISDLSKFHNYPANNFS